MLRVRCNTMVFFKENSGTHVVRVADDLLPARKNGVTGDPTRRHRSLELLHGIAASSTAVRAPAVNTKTTGQGDRGKGAEDGGGGEMHVCSLEA